jgi:hypothetical protein
MSGEQEAANKYCPDGRRAENAQAPAYPGQAYFHTHNPRIKRAEENFCAPIDWSQVDGVETMRIMTKEECDRIRAIWFADDKAQSL